MRIIYIIYGGISQMESVIFVLLIIFSALMFNEISSLKKRVKSQEERINQLAKLTGYDNLSSYWVSDEVKELATHLKRTGKEVEAVKRIRKHTQMSLLEAKKYVDALD
jgi:ribosomal protein L7/L12